MTAVVVGDVARDYVMRVAAPDDEKARVLESWRLLGGTGANVAAQIHRLGGRVEFVSVVGDDALGGELLGELAEVGIGATHVQRRRGHSTVATIIIGAGRRSVYVDAGVGVDLTVEPSPLWARADRIFLSYAPRALTPLVEWGHGERVIVGLEAWMLDDAGFADALPGGGLVVTNAAGWNRLSSERRLAHLPVVVTDGGRPVRLIRGGEVVCAVTPPVIEVVDATGAGDAFAGALVSELVRGRPLPGALATAAAAGAFCASRPGALTGQGGPAEIAALQRGGPETHH